MLIYKPIKSEPGFGLFVFAGVVAVLQDGDSVHTDQTDLLSAGIKGVGQRASLQTLLLKHSPRVIRIQ